MVRCCKRKGQLDLPGHEPAQLGSRTGARHDPAHRGDPCDGETGHSSSFYDQMRGIRSIIARWSGIRGRVNAVTGMGYVFSDTFESAPAAADRAPLDQGGVERRRITVDIAK